MRTAESKGIKTGWVSQAIGITGNRGTVLLT
jgi:hypothetical protein